MDCFSWFQRSQIMTTLRTTADPNMGRRPRLMWAVSTAESMCPSCCSKPRISTEAPRPWAALCVEKVSHYREVLTLTCCFTLVSDHLLIRKHSSSWTMYRYSPLYLMTVCGCLLTLTGDRSPLSAPGVNMCKWVNRNMPEGAEKSAI